MPVVCPGQRASRRGPDAHPCQLHKPHRSARARRAETDSDPAAVTPSRVTDHPASDAQPACYGTGQVPGRLRRALRAWFRRNVLPQPRCAGNDHRRSGLLGLRVPASTGPAESARLLPIHRRRARCRRGFGDSGHQTCLRRSGSPGHQRRRQDLGSPPSRRAVSGPATPDLAAQQGSSSPALSHSGPVWLIAAVLAYRQRGVSIDARDQGNTMSNKPHQHPQKQKRPPGQVTRLLAAILLIALFLLGLALSATGHPVLLR